MLVATGLYFQLKNNHLAAALYKNVIRGRNNPRGVYEHLMLLSFAGVLLFYCSNKVNTTDIQNQVRLAVTEMHKRHVLHCDGKLRNILYDSQTGRVMMIDFDRAKICDERTPLGAITGNRQNRRKRRRIKLEARGDDDDFVREIESVLNEVDKGLEYYAKEEEEKSKTKRTVFGYLNQM